MKVVLIRIIIKRRRKKSLLYWKE